MEENLRKSLYKIILYCIKVIPYIVTVCYILYTALSFCSIYVEAIGYIAHLSILSWLFFYLCSFAFKFCILHRLPLYYILCNEIVNFSSFYIKIDINTWYILMLHSIILGIFILLYVWLSKRKKIN